jgi:hypothetical protein
MTNPPHGPAFEIAHVLHAGRSGKIAGDEMERVQPGKSSAVVWRGRGEGVSSWLRWVYHVAARGPGKKMVVIPEVWRHCNPDSVPPELALLAQAGRELIVELIVDTQRPEMLNGSLTASLTEIILFRQMSPDARRATEKLLMETGAAFDAEQLRALPLGSFVGFNRLSGASLAGRFFFFNCAGRKYGARRARGQTRRHG